MNDFGQELRRLRRRAGLSQEVLAQHAGLSPEAVSLLERGRRTPRMSTLRLLADGLRLDVRDRAALFRAASVESDHLPLPLPAFVEPLLGRTGEIAFLSERIVTAKTRLLTVTGPGGVGKTRIAVAVADSVAPHFPDGPRWLPLGSLTDARSVLSSLAAALGARESATPTLTAVVDHLRDQQCLLVIDNAEHLLAECRRLCTTILREAAGVQILLTSRVRLEVRGESLFVLSPLAVPEVSASAAEVSRTAASRLFLDRAQLSHAEDLHPAEVAAVARICQRLDGVPLAIELAAARAGVLSLGDLADALSETSDLLNQPDRERLTETVVGWSYRLLDARDQRLFERLSVFAGFSQEAAAEVVGEGLSRFEVLDALTSLLGKSLVYRGRDRAGHARFQLLEIIRDYAGSRLVEHQGGAERRLVEGAHGAPDVHPAEDVHRRHARYYTALAERAAPRLYTHEQRQWLAVLDSEVGNIRIAMTWAVRHEPEMALRLVSAMWRWCYRRGRYTEGSTWAAAALAAGADAPARLRAPVLAGGGMLCFLRCDYPAAKAHIEESLRLYESLGDDTGIGWALARLGSIARERADYPASVHLHERARQLAERIGDHHEVGVQINFLAFVSWLSGDLDRAASLAERALIAMRAAGDAENAVWALINCGVTARYRGDVPGAELLLAESLELAEQISFPEGVAWALNQLGAVARLNGDLVRAEQLLEVSLAEHRQLGDRWREASLLEELAAVATATGDYPRGAAHLGAASRIRADLGTPTPAVEQAEVQSTQRAIHTALGVTYAAAALLAGPSRSAPWPAVLVDAGEPELSS